MAECQELMADAQTNRTGLEDLAKALTTFKVARSILSGLYDNYEDYCRKLISSQNPEGGVFPFLVEDDFERLEKIKKKDPSLIITGQQNSGKSSLVNEILGGDYMPTKPIPNTARHVRISYAKHNSIKVISPDGQILETKTFQDKIPEEFIDLQGDSRDQDEEVRVRVDIGLNHPLLETGLVIVDIPGLGENDTLDELIMSLVDGVLQIMVYVIDGKNKLKPADTEFVNKVKAKAPNLDIMYVCNKAESDKQAHRMDQHSDDEDAVDDTDKSVEKELDIRTATLHRLEKHSLLDSSSSSSRTDNYHAISCKNTGKFRRSKRGRQHKYMKYFEDFNKFVLSVHAKIIKYVNGQLLRITTSISGAQKCLFDWLMDGQNAEAQISICRQKLSLMGNSVTEYFDKMRESVKVGLRTCIVYQVESEYLDNYHEPICLSASRMEMRPRKLVETDNRYLNYCRGLIRNFVITRLLEMIKQLIHELRHELVEIDSAIKGAMEFPNTDGFKVTFDYRSIRLACDDEFKMNELDETEEWFRMVVANVGSQVSKLVEDTESSRVGKVDTEWRRATAGDYLKNVVPATIAEIVSSAVLERVEQVSLRVFTMLLNIERLLCTEEEKVKENQEAYKDIVRDLCYDWNYSHCLTISIQQGNVHISEHPVHCGESSDIFAHSSDNQFVVKKFKKVSDLKQACLSHAKFSKLSNVLLLNALVQFDQHWNMIFLVQKMQSNLTGYLNNGVQLSYQCALQCAIDLVQSAINIQSQGLGLQIVPEKMLVDTRELGFKLVYNWLKRSDPATSELSSDSLTVNVTKLIAFLVIPKAFEHISFYQNRGAFYDSLVPFFQPNSEFDLAMGAMFRKHLDCVDSDLQSLLDDLKNVRDLERI